MSERTLEQIILEFEQIEQKAANFEEDKINRRKVDKKEVKMLFKELESINDEIYKMIDREEILKYSTRIMSTKNRMIWLLSY